jgi:hypothetical protein
MRCRSLAWPLYGHAVYDTMCIVYHDDGSVERFFVRP